MLIQNLSLKNFKCFEEVDVEFAPITLLTGANSSGKSSLIYSLLAVLQTEQFPFYLSPNGKYVNLGGFEEMVKFKKFIKIEKGERVDFIEIAFKGVNRLGQSAYYKTLWQKRKIGGTPQITSFELKIPNWNVSVRKEQNKYFLNLELYDSSAVTLFDIQKDSSYSRLLREAKTNPEKKHLLVEDLEFNSIDEVISSLQLAPWSLRDELEFFVTFFNDDFNYIGSFRQPPERTYYQKAKAQSKVDTDGAGYIDQIIEWEETNPEKLAELAKIMSELELFQEIRSNKFKGGRFELAVKTQKNSEMAALTDVGFGISQFLPIIVADLQLDDHSCLALSQPEIHLHPKIQALFGNFLANQVKRTQKQYIVETHSEYLLNRIRLLLVKGELKPEDVRVYYFENDGIKTTTHKVELAPDGQIKGAPASFFDTYAMDVMDIALNA